MRRNVIGELGTMFLGVTAILIASVIIAIGSGGKALPHRWLASCSPGRWV